MGVRLGIVGRGYWGNTYAKVLDGLRIPYWQDGRGWHMRHADGIIVACSSHAHYWVAKCALGRGIPVLVEKPITMHSDEAWDLVKQGGIGYAGHTRLYADEWQEFKDSLRWHGGSRPQMIPQAVEAWAGGVNETNPDTLWNWIPHLAAMCLDIGFDPYKATLHIHEEKRSVRLVADGREFTDGKPGAIANLVRAFVKAIERGKPDNEGLFLGAQVVEVTERLRKQAHTRGLTAPFHFGEPDDDRDLQRAAAGGGSLERTA